MIYVCPKNLGGCGLVCHENELGRVPCEYEDALENGLPEETLYCPNCDAEAVEALDGSNTQRLVDEGDIILVNLLLEGDESVAGISDCECDHYDNVRMVCEHSVKLARDLFYSGKLL